MAVFIVSYFKTVPSKPKHTIDVCFLCQSIIKRLDNEV